METLVFHLLGGVRLLRFSYNEVKVLVLVSSGASVPSAR